MANALKYSLFVDRNIVVTLCTFFCTFPHAWIRSQFCFLKENVLFPHIFDNILSYPGQVFGVLTLTRRLPRIRYIRGNCAGRMPHIRNMRSLFARTDVAHTLNAECTPIYSVIFKHTRFSAGASSSPAYNAFYRSAFN